jgi:hypothetical protein
MLIVILIFVFIFKLRPYDLNSWFEMLLINIAKTVAHSCKHKFQSLSRDQDINDGNLV